MKPIFQMSADARLLLGRLEKASVGELLAYDELSAVISRPVGGAFGPLRTALRRMLRDHDAVFACVTGKGVKRLSDAEIVDEGVQAMDKVRRRAQRSVERQMKADFSKLDRERQARFSAQVSVMGTIAFMARGSSVEKLAKATTPDRKELPVAETLKLFAK
ncbi:hypothetical protein EN851_07610 [Mesorhizobium sp. M8A.F.Ca.ET.208.01.1.1]|uniref:hypothetical protein n=1 Tax=unclassified Mesorhizobium TaxID=325217 RepID=UPI001093E0DD|nr:MULTISPECIES: hypothetical protein [unclassified Mesorhizobium]TGQ95380.1 hypothetical protein EN851_07610 [Mesorhizobium sp. M8A.F.Ca.ET.208.01.1.1]TGT55871.1 hypothetical protein EN810_07610 [Mesorhizobium sp. M8A.F.Ca.ET.167.01.1.1]